MKLALRLLQQISTGAVRLGAPDEDVAFHETVLDCSVLAVVTGTTAGLFDAPAVGDRTRLGRIRSYRKILEGADDDKVVDWYFALRIRASIEKQVGCVVPDLRDDPRFKHKDRNEKAGDFLLTFAGNPELVECKRVHPKKPIRSAVGEAARKVRAWVPKALTQLETSARILECPSATKHLMIDISDYFPDFREECLTGRLVRVSGCDESRARQVYESVPRELWSSVDRVTFCWRNLINIDGLPYAVIHAALEMRNTSRVSHQFTYNGWTVEWYPFEPPDVHRHLAVSNVARSIPWVVIRYNSICYNSSFFIVEETRPS